MAKSGRKTKKADGTKLTPAERAQAYRNRLKNPGAPWSIEPIRKGLPKSQKAYYTAWREKKRAKPTEWAQHLKKER